MDLTRPKSPLDNATVEVPGPGRDHRLAFFTRMSHGHGSSSAGGTAELSTCCLSNWCTQARFGPLTLPISGAHRLQRTREARRGVTAVATLRQA